MSKNNYFGEGIVFTISDYIVYFLEGSLFFWLLNFPLLFYLLLISNDSSYFSSTVLFFLSILIYPAFTALLYSMNKLIKNNSVHMISEYFKSYKENFINALILGIIQNLLFYFLYYDNLYVKSFYNMDFFHYLFIILLLICISINFFIFPILSKFYIKKRYIYRLSLFYLIQKPYIPLTGLLMLFILYMIAFNISFLLSLVLTSIFCYILMYMLQKTLVQLESSIN